MSLDIDAMSSSATHKQISYGKRTLPQTLEDLAYVSADRLYASVRRQRDLSNGFVDVSCTDMARCANLGL